MRANMHMTPPTEAVTIEASMAAFYSGDFDIARGYWDEILTMNGNFLQAIEGQGRVLLRNGYYREAMDLFRMIDSNGKYASRAFWNYRKQIIDDSSTLIFVLVMLIAAAFIARQIYRLFRWLRKEAQG